MARAQTANVIVRYAVEQHALVKAAAKRAGLSLNQFVVLSSTDAAALPEVSAVVEIDRGGVEPKNPHVAARMTRHRAEAETVCLHLRRKGTRCLDCGVRL